MIYRQYTVSNREEVLVIYKCSQCKTWHAVKHPITSNSTYNSKGAFTNTMLENRQADAEARAVVRGIKKEFKIRDEAKRNCYHTARMSFACPNCGNREPWAKMSFPVAYFVTKVGKFIAVLATCFWALTLMNAENYLSTLKETWLTFVPWYLPLILSYAYIFISRLVLDKKIKEIPKESLPIICWTQEEIETALKNLPDEALNN